MDATVLELVITNVLLAYLVVLVTIIMIQQGRKR